MPPRHTPPSPLRPRKTRPPGDRYYCYRYRSKASSKRGGLRFPFTLPLRPITSDHDTDGFTDGAGRPAVSVSQYAWNRFVRSFVRSSPVFRPPSFSSFAATGYPAVFPIFFPPFSSSLSFYLSFRFRYTCMHACMHARGYALLNTETATIAFFFFFFFFH